LVSILPLLASDQSTSESGPSSLLVDPLLAYVKAFRLRGAKDDLKDSLWRRFEPSHISTSVKLLYNYCKDNLRRLGFTLQVRRSSDRRQLFDSVYADLINAFNLLDGDDCLPLVYTEAIDLLAIPTLVMDPVSEQISINTAAIESVGKCLAGLPAACAESVSEQIRHNTVAIESVGKCLAEFYPLLVLSLFLNISVSVLLLSSLLVNL